MSEKDHGSQIKIWKVDFANSVRKINKSETHLDSLHTEEYIEITYLF